MSTILTNILRIQDPTGLSYCLGTLSASEIKQLTMVPVVTESIPTDGDEYLQLNENSDHGYQRAGETKRMIQITNFVKDRPPCVIPPVLLSCRGKWTFVSDKNNSDYGTLEADELAAIVDGQHRLGGLWRLVNDDNIPDEVRDKPIPFMAILDMPLEREREEFVDINGKQIGVKKSLIAYLDREDTFVGRAADALMNDEESVFRGRIDEQKQRDWTLILFKAAQECVGEMFGSELTVKFDPEHNEDQQEMGLEFVLRYWQIVSESLPQYWSDVELLPVVGTKKSKDRPGRSKFRYRLLEETGIRAFSRLAQEVMNYAWIDGASSPSWDTVADLMRRLGTSEELQWVLSKPRLNPEVAKRDVLLKSTGKAGVTRIFGYLKKEFMRAIQSR